MDTFNLRLADRHDVMAISTLCYKAYEKWVRVIGRPPLPMMADYGRAVVKHRLYLHERAGELLALIELIDRQDHLLIENLAVLPGCQGQGLGGQLLGFADDMARQQGYDRVVLQTNALMHSNRTYYARRGYAEIGRADFSGGGVVVTLEKLLS